MSQKDFRPIFRKNEQTDFDTKEAKLVLMYFCFRNFLFFSSKHDRRNFFRRKKVKKKLIFFGGVKEKRRSEEIGRK